MSMDFETPKKVSSHSTLIQSNTTVKKTYKKSNHFGRSTLTMGELMEPYHKNVVPEQIQITNFRNKQNVTEFDRYSSVFLSGCQFGDHGNSNGKCTMSVKPFSLICKEGPSCPDH